MTEPEATKKQFTVNMKLTMDPYSAYLTLYDKTRQVDLFKFSKQILSNSTLDTGLLPPVTRYISPTGNAIVIERPPSMVTCSFSDSVSGGGGAKSYNISIPWTLYYITACLSKDAWYIDKVGMFWEAGSLNSKDDKLISAPFPNLYVNTSFNKKNRPGVPSFCLSKHFRAKEYKNISELAIDALNMVWQSDFNGDIIDAMYNIKYIFPAMLTENLTPKTIGRLLSEVSIDELTKKVENAFTNNNDLQTITFGDLVDALQDFNLEHYPRKTASRSLMQVFEACSPVNVDLPGNAEILEAVVAPTFEVAVEPTFLDEVT